MSEYGPNVSNIIQIVMIHDAIPPGGGLAAAVEFIKNPDVRAKALARAESKIRHSLNLIKAAPDNTWGDDDEVIAGMLLKELEKRLNVTYAAYI